MYDFCGIGNACIDIIVDVEDAFLSEWNFPKGICSYLELDRADALEKALIKPQYIAGGCAANTAEVITNLGGTASFMGAIADDAIGKILIEDMKRAKIDYTGIPDATPGAGSTRIFTFVTPDTERTFAAYYGVQENLSPRDLNEGFIARSKYMYLDGYALNSPMAGETFLKAAHIALRNNSTVVFSPSDLSILEKHPDVIKELIAVSSMILCNEQEAKHIAGTDNIDRALKELSGMFQAGAVTSGARGAHVFSKDETILVQAAMPPAPVMDTNGAGDGFAGGFLYGLAREMDIVRAGKLGNRCAASIITHSGARPTSSYKPFLNDL